MGQEIQAKDSSPEQTQHYPWSVSKLEDYEALFEGAEKHKAVGEVSPMYLYNADAPRRIHDLLPNVKIVAILRQPVDRLYSRYMHLVREHRVPTDDFSDALDRQSIWWRRNDLVTEGFYATNIKRYQELFHPNQIKVFLYEDLRLRPQETLANLFEFIGVDPSFSPHFGGDFNKSGKIKNRTLDKIIGQKSLLLEGARKISPSAVESLKKSTLLKSTLNHLRNRNLQKVALSTDLRLQMTRDIYQGEINQLETLINRDLSAWKA